MKKKKTPKDLYKQWYNNAQGYFVAITLNQGKTAVKFTWNFGLLYSWFLS